MIRKHVIIFLGLLVLQGCTINMHTTDRAIMLEKGRTEWVTGGTGSGGFFDGNLGAGTGFRVGVNDKITLGIRGDINISSASADWAPNVYYGKLNLEQKFSLFPNQIPDRLAFKMIEGYYWNNFTGTAQLNSETGDYELINPKPYVPYLGGELLFTPEDNRPPFTTIVLRASTGFFDYHTALQSGLAVVFDFTKNNFDRHAVILEFGGSLQYILDSRTAWAFHVGLSYSLFSKRR